jgi:hypothetical protein
VRFRRPGVSHFSNQEYSAMQQAYAEGARATHERRQHVPAVPPLGTTLAFDTIRSAGAYVCNWSGHLLRIPARASVPGEALRFNLVGRAPLTVTKISDDPGISLPEARTIAARLGLRTGF